MAGSCVSKKALEKARMQQELFQTGFDSLMVKPLIDPKIQPYDQLFIQVYSETLSQDQAQLFNSSYDPKTPGYYVVDVNGYIEMPILGKILVKGITGDMVSELIKAKLKPYVQQPGVIVKLKSFKVKVIGELNAQTVLDMGESRPTLLDALAKIGGVKTESANDSITVIREEETGIKKYTVNLRNVRSVYESPVYQLQQNDIIYIPGNEIRNRAVVDRRRASNTMFISYVNLLLGIANLIVIFSNLR
jgi:polysaccharide export outer membrane protein